MFLLGLLRAFVSRAHTPITPKVGLFLSSSLPKSLSLGLELVPTDTLLSRRGSLVLLRERPVATGCLDGTGGRLGD
jgi:hypothetical protein